MFSVPRVSFANGCRVTNNTICFDYTIYQDRADPHCKVYITCTHEASDTGRVPIRLVHVARWVYIFRLAFVLCSYPVGWAKSPRVTLRGWNGDASAYAEWSVVEEDIARNGSMPTARRDENYTELVSPLMLLVVPLVTYSPILVPGVFHLSRWFHISQL